LAVAVEAFEAVVKLVFGVFFLVFVVEPLVAERARLFFLVLFIIFFLVSAAWTWELVFLLVGENLPVDVRVIEVAAME
jgi:hypothetical protein